MSPKKEYPHKINPITSTDLLALIAHITSELDLEEVLNRLALGVGELLEHEATAVFLSNHSVITTPPHIKFKPTNNPHLDQIKQSHQPILLPNTQADTYWKNLLPSDIYQSSLSLPLLANNKLSGILTLVATQPNYFQAEHIDQLTPLCHIATIAIQNAQQYEQATSVAILKERQRLAQQLHDSVSQTVFAANTMAELISRIIDKNLPKAKDYLGELEILTRGAMAEMRSLMIELYPEALAQTELNILLKQLCDAFTGHTRIPVTYTGTSNLFLAADSQIACYRIAQEALNNIAKHGRASQVQVKIIRQKNMVELSIEDDGQGFLLEEGLIRGDGLNKIRIRAQNIGATCTIHTQKGAGTIITVSELSI